VQGEVLAASDHLERIELQILHGAHGLFGPLAAAPAPPGLQSLLAKDEAPGDIDIDGQHAEFSSLGSGKLGC
jgi:hypothetical protein